jgi:hypothetical protein
MGTILNNATHHRFPPKEEIEAIDRLVFNAILKAGDCWRIRDIHEELTKELRIAFKTYTVLAQRTLIRNSLYRLRRAGRISFGEHTHFWSIAGCSRQRTD